MQKIRVMLNSHDLATIIDTYEMFNIVDIFDTEKPSVAVESAKLTQPDVILCEVDQYHGAPIQLITTLKGVCPLSLIILLAYSATQDDVLNAIKAGVDSYLLYDNMTQTELANIIELIYESKVCFFPKLF